MKILKHGEYAIALNRNGFGITTDGFCSRIADFKKADYFYIGDFSIGADCESDFIPYCSDMETGGFIRFEKIEKREV